MRTALFAAAVALAVAGAPARPAFALRPIVFVHGFSGSGAQYETPAMRFASNGYPPDYIRVHEYDSLFGVETRDQVLTRLDSAIGAILAETGADKIDLAAHSLGTSLMQAYLRSSAARAAKVAHYINLDGATATSPPGGVPTLAIWGRGDPARTIVGAQNVHFPDQTHVQVVTSPESFAAQFRFLTGVDPTTTDVLPEPVVRLAGRAVIFPQNVGVADASVQIFEVDAATGGRLRPDPDAVFPVSSASGAFGPFDAVGGRHYEFVIVRPGERQHHFYEQPLIRTDLLIRLLTVEPTSPFATNTDISPDTATLVITRYREFWGDQGPNDDVLRINGLNIISPTNSPIAKLVNAMFVFDDGLDRVNDLVTPNAFYFALPFITAMDVFMPGANPPNGVIRLESHGRGGVGATLNVPNWASSQHAESIIFHPHVQPTTLAVPASRQDLACEAGTSGALAAFVADKGRCIQRCVARHRQAGGPYTECRAPYSGATAACIDDARTGAATRARARVGRVCARGCPACWQAGGNCPDGAGFVAGLERIVDATDPLVRCVEATGGTPTRAQARCEGAAAKALIRFTRAKTDCSDRCVARAFQGRVPAGNCTVGRDSADAETAACVILAEANAAAAIDKACAPSAATPPCWAPSRDSGVEWVAAAENLVDGETALVYCGAPPPGSASGAFVE